MFREALAAIADKVEGTEAISLMGIDGIAVDTINRSGIALDGLGAELGSLVKTICSSNLELETGRFEQFTLTSSRYTTIVSAVTTDYFILMVLLPGANYGRARFELKRARHILKDELI